jgi:hypothetical protein
MSDSRQVWKFSVIIEASRADAERVSEAIFHALCPEPHPDLPRAVDADSEQI